MRALAHGADAEVFAFATALTRLTRSCAKSAPAPSSRPRQVTDRFGGTRIATTCGRCSPPPRRAVRGAIVIIGSDGWDSDPPEDLAAAMARLRRRAHR